MGILVVLYIMADIPVSSSSHIYVFYYWAIKHSKLLLFFLLLAHSSCSLRMDAQNHLLSEKVSLAPSPESQQYLWWYWMMMWMKSQWGINRQGFIVKQKDECRPLECITFGLLNWLWRNLKLQFLLSRNQLERTFLINLAKSFQYSIKTVITAITLWILLFQNNGIWPA